ncbi:bifunctional DNA primase/polymerase [Gelria sp. Kuro-4]|uniref:bifunctional DNA primase/polymerase n=1 Tax=Gelria sp. Kuro-4 TaxID=2796927 RepID=UPI001BF0CB35|nr:bifunctional DNA primase/polymerase [Gelria sp. Kuro-4]BCV23272.1 hypothetical protein kuro4_00450 [Gelria sp. Kuro-4]
MGKEKPKRAALHYGKLGWSVLPLCWPDKAGKCACGWNHPDKSVGKAPRVKGGVTAATNDKEQIASWWKQMPEANIGIAVAPSNLLVLDADGEEAIKEIEAAGVPEGTPVASSSRGRHYYFTRPQDVPLIPRTHLGLSGGIDIPQYVIAPPSRHHSGHEYQWLTAPTGTPPPAPDWVIALMQSAADSTNTEENLPPEPSQDAATAVAKALFFLLPTNARQLWRGNITSNDRSGLSYALACAAVDAKITDPWAIACLVFSSAPHRNKFDSRKDGWLDAYRLTERALAEKGQAPQNQDSWELVSLEDIPEEDVTFLITPYLPRGEITMLEGDPGEGKSFVWMAWAAGLTGSKLCPIPYDTTAPTNCRVVIITTEDSIGKTVKKRLRELGAVLKNIFIFRSKGGDEGQVTAADFAEVQEQVISLAPDLIVVDPITLYATGDSKFDMDKNTHVRNLLKPLLATARQLNAACLVVRHYRKGAGKAIYRGLGSIDVTATARSQLSIGKDKTGQRYAAHAKSNLAPKGPTLKFSLGGGVPPFKWEGIVEDITADDLTDETNAANREGKSAVNDAEDWLFNFLSEGPCEGKTCIAEAKKNGISLRTLERAKSSLNVEVKWQGRKTLWSLPENKQEAG